MLLLVIVCVVLTLLIVRHFTTDEIMDELPWEEQTENQGKRQDQVMLLQNVYITSCEDNKINFLYYDRVYSFVGVPVKPYIGVADLMLKNGQIERIYTKTDYIEGTILSMDQEGVEVDGYGKIPHSEQMSVYRDKDGAVLASSAASIIFGVSKLKYIVADNEICALIMDKEYRSEDIRVLIKRDGRTTYDTLNVTSDTSWSINGTVFEPNEIVEMNAYIQNMSLPEGLATSIDDPNQVIMGVPVKRARIQSDHGFLYFVSDDKTEYGPGYEGVFYVQEAGEQVSLVNQLPIDTYVRYVLPSEMPSSFSYEALKAQAVCARTFAYSQMKNARYAAYGANLDNTSSYQVYNTAGTKEITDQAARDTYGEVLTQDGELVTCYYYSTSPGYTTGLDVWASDEEAYIAPVCTILQPEEEEYQLSKEYTFRDYINTPEAAYDSSSAFYRWIAEISLDDITHPDYGRLKEAVISKRNDSGYVTMLSLVYDHGVERFMKEGEIRDFFGQHLTHLTLANGKERENFKKLPSACFYIRTHDGGSYTLVGGGFGHGIGMSQYAADGMGDAGMSYKEILSYFYKDTTIEQW